MQSHSREGLIAVTTELHQQVNQSHSVAISVHVPVGRLREIVFSLFLNVLSSSACLQLSESKLEITGTLMHKCKYSQSFHVAGPTY